MPSTVTWRSCIASSRAACVRGGVRLISSASSTFVKTTPWMNVCSPARITFWPVSSAGRRVGRELDALELRAEHVRRGASEQRLRASGRSLDQHVSAGERRDEQELDRRVLSDDHLRDLGLRALAQVDEVLVRRLDDECHYPRPPPLCFICRYREYRSAGVLRTPSPSSPLELSASRADRQPRLVP